MRWSEPVGLRRSKVDLRRRKVRVTDQLDQLENRSWLRKEPRRRLVSLDHDLAGDRGRLGRSHGPVRPVGLRRAGVPNAPGNPVSASSFRTHYFSPALRAAGVACRFHDLRHTSVALAIAAGAHPKAIQMRMGHASITVTLDRYGHLFPELDEAIAEEFGRQLADARRRRETNVVHVRF
jgi:integrase